MSSINAAAEIETELDLMLYYNFDRSFDHCERYCHIEIDYCVDHCDN